MKREVKVSIIIPVYNSEKYLKECIESVINQNYSDMELILVDDGSSDNSYSICSKYKNEYPNISLFHQKNQGVSVARNLGLKYAKGKYIFFLDSDDLMIDNLLHSINEYLDNNYDMLIGNMVNWDSKKNISYIENDVTKVSPKELTDIYKFCEFYAIKNYQIPWAPYQSFWKRKIIVDNDLSFDKAIKVGEDCDFYFRYINYVKKFKIVKYPFVKYRIDSENSLMKIQNYSSIISQLIVFDKMCKLFTKKTILLTYFANRFVSTIFQIEFLKSSIDKKKCYDFVSYRLKILDYSNKKIKKYNIFYKLVHIFGLKTTTKIFRSCKYVISYLNNRT